MAFERFPPQLRSAMLRLRPVLLLTATATVTATFSLHCAAENPPTGGSPDTEGPRVIRVEPPSGTLDLDPNQIIEITFNEQVDPVSVPGSVVFTPEVSFTTRVRGKRVLIRPASPSESQRTDPFPAGDPFGVGAGGFQDGCTYILTLQRGIRDYRKNSLAQPYQLVFSTGGHIPTGRIQGRIIETNAQRPVEVGLFQRTDSGFVRVQSIDLAADGSFSFNYLPDGTYRLAAVEGGLDGFPATIHRRPYALIPADSLLVRGDTITTAMCQSPPLARPRIQSVEWITPTYLTITFDMPFGEAQLPPNLYPTDDPLTFGHLLRPGKQISDTTVIDLGQGYTRLGEPYRLEPLAIPTPELVDTIPPIPTVSGGQVVLEPAIGRDGSQLEDISSRKRYGEARGRITFSEPVHLPPNLIAHLIHKDSSRTGEDTPDVPLRQVTPFTAVLDISEPELYSQVSIPVWEITDEAGNAMTDSLLSFALVYSPPGATGSIRGTIIGFSGHTVVEVRDAATSRRIAYTVTDSADLSGGTSQTDLSGPSTLLRTSGPPRGRDGLGQTSYFLADIPPGFYTLFGHEQVGAHPVPYYSGRWEPYKRAARFSFYPEVVEVRPRWEVDSIDINFTVTIPILPLVNNAVKRE